MNSAASRVQESATPGAAVREEIVSIKSVVLNKELRSLYFFNIIGRVLYRDLTPFSCILNLYLYDESKDKHRNR